MNKIFRCDNSLNCIGWFISWINKSKWNESLYQQAKLEKDHGKSILHHFNWIHLCSCLSVFHIYNRDLIRFSQIQNFIWILQMAYFSVMRSGLPKPQNKLPSVNPFKISLKKMLLFIFGCFYQIANNFILVWESAHFRINWYLKEVICKYFLLRLSIIFGNI